MDELTIVIPGKNESENIETLLQRIGSALDKSTIRYSIIYINDGSTDDSAVKLSRASKDYPLTVIEHAVSQGKAKSIIEGVLQAKSDSVVMIDADLQYPPEAIPEMFTLRAKYPVVVAWRVENNEKWLRKVASKVHAFIFCELLFGLKCDVQAGLKLFPKELIKSIDMANVTPWTLDLSLLYTAQQLGMAIGEVPIRFEARLLGKSKVNILRSFYEHSLTSVKIRFSQRKIVRQ